MRMRKSNEYFLFDYILHTKKAQYFRIHIQRLIIIILINDKLLFTKLIRHISYKYENGYIIAFLLFH